GPPGGDPGRWGAGLLGAHMPILVRRHVNRLQPYRSMSARRQALISSPCGQDIRFQIWCRGAVARLVYDSLPKALDHPVDHPDDPTGSVWSRPDRRRAPGYGSGGWGFESLAARHMRRSEAL